MFKKIKIFTIATNNYKEFIDDYLESFSSLFLPNIEKIFYIFIDDLNFKINNKSAQVEKIRIDHKKWPEITLNRYKYIKSILNSPSEDELYVFTDIDLIVNREISALPIDKLFGVSHPGNYFVDNIHSLEMNPLSSAFVDRNNLPEGYSYIQGCFWGGLGNNFLNLINHLYESTEKDLCNNIVAKWHDESHLNKYYINNFNDFKILSSSYAYPENWNLNIPKLIIHKDKNMKEYPRHPGI